MLPVPTHAIVVPLEGLCASAGCLIQPSYGSPGGQRTHCIAHKAEGEIYLKIKCQCVTPGCLKKPSYGPPGGWRSHCAVHRVHGEVSHDKGPTRPCCVAAGCRVSPIYGPPSGPRRHCFVHQVEGEVSLRLQARKRAMRAASEAPVGDEAPKAKRTRLE
jgi:hypothetical protein